MPSKRAAQRIEAGLCPTCGKDAAPYRLCFMCRQKLRFFRALKRMARTGSLEVVEGTGGNTLYRKTGKPVDGRWSVPIHPDENDRRFRPRISGVPVNVEETIIRIFQSIGRPCTVDEVVQAWGKLRTERKRGTVVADVRALVEAQQRRERRAAKRRGPA